VTLVRSDARQHTGDPDRRASCSPAAVQRSADCGLISCDVLNAHSPGPALFVATARKPCDGVDDLNGATATDITPVGAPRRRPATEELAATHASRDLGMRDRRRWPRRHQRGARGLDGEEPRPTRARIGQAVEAAVSNSPYSSGSGTGPHGHERQLCQPLMEPCESRSGGAVFAVLVVSAQPQDGGRCLLGPTLRNEVEVVICDVEHVETAAVGRVRVVDRALGVL